VVLSRREEAMMSVAWTFSSLKSNEFNFDSLEKKERGAGHWRR